MGIGSVLSLLTTGKEFVDKNKSAILTVTSVIFSVKAAYDAYKQADKFIKAKEELKEKEAGLGETVKTLAPIAAPVIFDLVIAGSSAVGAHMIDHGAIVELEAGLALTQQQLETHISKIEEKYGEEAAKEIVQEVAKEQAERKKVEKVQTVKNERRDRTILCYEPWTNTEFRTTLENLDAAISEFNRKGYAWGADLDDWLNILNVRSTPATTGWYWPQEAFMTGVDIMDSLTDENAAGEPYKIIDLWPRPTQKHH